MINEKELRTGNLYITIRNVEIMVTGIDTLNKFVSVVPSNTDTNSANESSVIFEDLNPIEITATILCKLGFSEERSMSIEIISDNTARFSWSEKLNQVVLMDGNNGTIGQEIKYIHQFQNIYYYLTGHELGFMGS